jgi:ubiquinone/menaquinone biosynthesis C-methylase UbiE
MIARCRASGAGSLAAVIGPLVLLSMLAAPPVGGSTPAVLDPPYTQVPPSRDGIGKVYMGREISQVMGHRGAAWLERASRLGEEMPDRLIDSLDLAKDAVVADIGAGTGYFTFRLSRRVPQGRVYAVDIQPEMLTIIRRPMARLAIDNVEPLLGTVDDPGLPPNSVDAVLMVDAYHEFSHPFEMMQGVLHGLRPGGRVFLVEYRGEDRDLPIKRLHKMTEAQAKREMLAVGLTWEKTLQVLPTQHLMVFRKP